MLRLQVDEHEYAYLKAIVLFSPGICQILYYLQLSLYFLNVSNTYSLREKVLLIF